MKNWARPNWRGLLLCALIRACQSFPTKPISMNKTAVITSPTTIFQPVLRRLSLKSPQRTIIATNDICCHRQWNRIDLTYSSSCAVSISFRGRAYRYLDRSHFVAASSPFQIPRPVACSVYWSYERENVHHTFFGRVGKG